MTAKNIQILDTSGNYLYPKTKAAVVVNSNGETLESVEAGAQVNLVEKITVNGTELSITDKTVDITIDDAAEYSIEKAATAGDGINITSNTITIDVDFLSDKIDTAIAGKADSAATLSGYGITDAYTKTEVDDLELA